MAGFPEPRGPWPTIRRDLDRPNRRSVVAVVAYIGNDAPAVMPLRAGDILVCDASDAAIKGRLTSVAALKAYRRRGVELFSLEGLHAKVITSPTSAWIGSTNASSNSENELVEAAVRVTGQQAKSLRRWSTSLATEDCLLGPADLTRLAALKLHPQRGGPRRTVHPKALPDSARRLVFWRLGGQLSKREEAAIERDRPAAKLAARRAGLPSSLDPRAFIGDTVVKPGDWLITAQGGRVQAPAFVVRVTLTKTGGTAWLTRVRTPARPTMGTLRSLEPRLNPATVELEIRRPAVVASILDAFR